MVKSKKARSKRIKISKKVTREKSADSKSGVSRKDFEAFQFGVERLKEIKKRRALRGKQSECK